MVHVGFASVCIGDAWACACVSPRVHRVHSVMALCDYAIAYVSHRFALLVVLRASEMHGYACGRVRVPRRWFCLECMVGRRVAGGPSRTITHDFACVGGGGGRIVSFASLRVVSSRSSVSLLCVHMRGRVDAGLRLLRPRDLWVSLVSSHVHVCSEMIGRVFACLQRSNWSRV